MSRVAGGLACATGLGFGPLGVYGTVYFAKHGEVWHFMGFPTYGDELARDLEQRAHQVAEFVARGA